MCGRYQFTETQSDEIAQIVREIERQYGAGALTPGEIRPTGKAPVLISKDEHIRPELLTWGYQTPNSLVINARAETAAEKPMFRSSVVSKRCVIPSTGFFEWDGRKRKYLFTLPGTNELYMAGLYDVRNGLPCYCILTTAANESMREVHLRMPLVLEKQQVEPWLEKPERAADFLRMEPPILEKTPTDGQLWLW